MRGVHAVALPGGAIRPAHLDRRDGRLRHGKPERERNNHVLASTRRHGPGGLGLGLGLKSLACAAFCSASMPSTEYLYSFALLIFVFVRTTVPGTFFVNQVPPFSGTVSFLCAVLGSTDAPLAFSLVCVLVLEV